MAVITIFRNPFSDESQQITVEGGISVAEAICFDPDRSIIFVNSFKRDHDWIIRDEDICLIREFPENGSSNPLTYALALINPVAFFSTVATWYASDFLSNALTGRGIIENVALGLTKLLGLDDLSEASNTDSLEKIPQLRGAKNQTGLDKPIPLVLGTHLLTPYYCGSPYTCIDPSDGTDGENQYFCALYMLGYSNLQIQDIKLGELLLASNISKTMNGLIPIDGIYTTSKHETQIEIQQSGEVSLYTQKIIEEQLSIMLYNVEGYGYDAPPIRSSSFNPMKIEIEILLNGLQGYNTSGDKENRTVLLKAQWRPLGGADSQWTNIGQFKNSDSYDASTGITRFTRCKNKQSRFIAVYEFGYDEIMAISSGLVEVKVTRENAQGNDGRTSDDVYWSAIRTYCYDETSSKAAGSLVPQVPVIAKDRARTCRLGFKIKAGSDVAGTLSALNGVVSSVARTWNGTSWISMADAISNSVVSNNPASIALLALQQKHLYSNVYADSELDMAAFGELYDFCAEKGFTCNGVITTQLKERTLLENILTTCRSQLIIKDGKYAPLIDKPRSYPMTLLNQQNTMSASNSKSFDVLPDGLKITFVDEEDGYQTSEIYCMYDGKSSSDPDMVFQDVQFALVTNRVHAWKLGRYVLACMKLRPEAWTRKVSVEGYTIPVGSLISVQDDTINVGLNEGGIIKSLIINGSQITGIILDSLFGMVVGNDYGVKIIQIEGQDSPKLRTAQVITAEGYTNTLNFTIPIDLSELVLPSEGDIIAFGIFSKITVDALVIGRTPGNDQTFELTLVPYDEAIYTADSTTIPDFDSKTTKPLPVPSTNTISETHPTIEQVEAVAADRPTYTEIAQGFTQAGLVVIPTQLNVTAVGGFRFITITWAKQSNLSNLKEYQIQCSEDAITWYAPSLDGSGINGHGTAADAFFSTSAPMLVHPNIPPAGSESAPAGRLVYYRVRQRTALDACSEWSSVIAATTKVADTGDYAANSISANALKVAELYTLLATIGDTLIVDPNAGLAAQNVEYSEGDTRSMLTANELLFQYVKNGAWSTIVRLALEGLRTNQVYSTDKLFITNNNMAGRRLHGFDIGIPYLSANSRVCHFDSDLYDQTGADYFTLSGTGALVGKDDGIPPAIVAVAPYATEAKSLYGNFRLQKTLGAINTFTLDFWILYYYNENQEIFRVGSASEYASIDVLNSEPYYNEDSFQYNDTITGSAWYNEIQGAVARVVYYLNGVFDIRYIQDASGNPALVPGSWYHIGVIDSGSSLMVIVNTTKFTFTSPSARTESVAIDINSTLGQFLVDEVLVDASVAETDTAFIANTSAKKPWAKLSDGTNWFVVDLKDPANFKTNMFESQVFKDSVLAIAAPKV